MINDGNVPREFSGLVVPQYGSLEVTGDLFVPYRLVDGDGAVIVPVAAFFAELAACGGPATTQRSYGMDLLRWFRFVWALRVDWDQATRVEARDFCRWLQLTTKPVRPHWRSSAGALRSGSGARTPATTNAVTGKPSRGGRYEASTAAHCESVLRGPWAVRCPVSASDVSHKKDRSRRKSRMDQRTRERLPVLPALVSWVETERARTAELLSAAEHTQPGALFTAGQALRRTVMKTETTGRVWAEHPDGGPRRNLSFEEHRGFWTWAMVAVLRHTGVRIEELTELAHHSLIQYRLPDTNELIPLLQIAPSKTDAERLLVISPELADVLSAVVARIRGGQTHVPLVVSYDKNERVYNPPMPLLFQWRRRLENRAVSERALRSYLDHALTALGVKDAGGRPMRYTFHDFRRLFITDAIMHGMPPHIAQLVAGHRDINTTMGYKAVYPEEVINGHRSFLARRRALRPSEEYRTPTDEEWAQFLGHFEHRKVSIGDCGRSYDTPCIHEHSCLRCPLLRPDPTARPRLVQIRDNLIARIAEAESHRWLGEAEGLKVSLAGARAKLAAMDQITARRNQTVQLGVPAFTDAAGRSSTNPTQRRHHP